MKDAKDKIEVDKYKNIIYCSVSVFLIYLILLNLAPKIFGSFQQGLGFGLGARHVGFLENFSDSNEPPSDFDPSSL